MNKNPMQALINAAKSKENEAKLTEVSKRVEEEILEKPNETRKVTEEATKPEPKIQITTVTEDENEKLRALGFDKYLHKRDKESLEIVRVPSSVHQKLKLISVISGISINALISNILDDVLLSNEKDISKILKRIK